jgi:hypothetical protein
MLAIMCAYVIGVVRSATRLDTLTFETRTAPNAAFPWHVEYACELQPLQHNSHYELRTAWHALASVSAWDQTTVEHVLMVLRTTVPSADGAPDLPTLGLEVHGAPEPRATAAHPRAFRGTKYRPPRPARPAPVDLRPYLLTRRHMDHVFEVLGQPRGIDPYVAWNHGADGTCATLDPKFVAFLLPLFRQCPWGDVGAFASLARTLQLHRHAELRAALVAIVVAADDARRAQGWWSHVLAHDEDKRIEAAKLVAQSSVAALAPLEPDVAALVVSLHPVQQWAFYRGLVAGASSAYLEAGVRLGGLSSTRIVEPPPGTIDVTSLVTSTVERLADAINEDTRCDVWRHHLWTLCGYQPELIDLLSFSMFQRLQPQAAFCALRLASQPRWTPETAEQEWRELARVLPLIVDYAERVPAEYQRKFVEDMSSVYSWAIANEHDVTDTVVCCVHLCLRVAKGPFGTKAVIGDLLPALALIYAEDLKWRDVPNVIRDAPESSWLALEAACKRFNQVRLLGRGLNRMSQYAPRLLASAFVTAPNALLQTADLLAAISFESAELVLDEYTRSPLADSGLADAPLERLCEVIAPIAGAGGPNPIRRALRRHFSGDGELTDAQVRGHRQRIVADLDVIRLAAIRQSIERQLAGRVGVEQITTPTVRHAAAMLNEVEQNRRQLRRMLTATLAGDTQWRLRHPRTVEWFAKHPKVNRERWLRGIETTGHIAGVGELRIKIERDPLEALKLGTYVGSCLGRGGNMEYSAAAVVLDVNKHVVYARDASGAVVGRQLVAISEADELVCFHVYGTLNVEQLEPLFGEYDRQLAAHLGLALFAADDDKYEIANILSLAWWDDSAWRGVTQSNERS